MTLSLPRTGRFTVLALALVYTGLSFGVATSTTPLAAQSGAYYTATLAQPAADDRAVAGGVAWACQDTTCVANKGSSRPSRICRGLAREFGEVTSFIANGEALTEEDLARCNGN
ncbi:CC_3452 family protein [Qipengyuania sp. ASV99]|uniref:CC_3452 family protein n=1 Tax=Qipengyuania sp. ASV99 TaxID=3399681 RepID=UPI003A4C7BBC